MPIITAIEAHHIRVPFDMGAPPTVFAGMAWTAIDSLFVRVVTDDGREGWGEGWGHAACAATLAALETMAGPACIGADATDVAGLHLRMAQRFHISGRGGPVTYALSAIDIALWDLAAQRANLPLYRLLGGCAVRRPRCVRQPAALWRGGRGGGGDRARHGARLPGSETA